MGETATSFWHRLSDKRPSEHKVVLVMSDGWERARLLRYEPHFHGKDSPAFLDSENGRWYWYPERMRWRESP